MRKNTGKKRSFKKALVLAMVGALSMSSLSGCSKGGAEPETNEAGEVIETTAEGETQEGVMAEDVVVETDAETESVEETTVANKAVMATEEETTMTSSWIPPKSKDGRWQKGKNGSWSFNKVTVKEDGTTTEEILTDSSIEVDGTTFYFGPDSLLVNDGWVKNGADWIYLLNGSAKTGWVSDRISNKSYYIGEDGKLSKGKVTVDKKEYIFDKDGALVDGWYQYKDNWYYTEKGLIVKDKEVEVDGKSYVLDKDGNMQSNKWMGCEYLGEDGSVTRGIENSDKMSFSYKNNTDKILNSLPPKLIEQFYSKGFRIIYNDEEITEMDEISSSGAVNFKEKFIKFHNPNSIYHRFGHFVDHDNNNISSSLKNEIREAEFKDLGFEEYFNKSNFEYFAEVCGQTLKGKVLKAAETAKIVEEALDKYK